MPLLDRSSLKSLSLGSASRLTHARLRRPTRLPGPLATTLWGRYLGRLRWLMGGF